jgi:hypothetical protein
MRALEALAHAEIDWPAGRWAVAPAALVALPGGGLHAVLAGRRLPSLELLVDGLADGALDVVVERWPQEDAPTAVFVGAGSWSDLVAAAAHLGVPFVRRFTAAMAPLLVRLAGSDGPTVEALPGGGEWFDATDLRWRRDEAPPLGLRRYQQFGTFTTYWNDGRGWSEVRMDEGRFLELRRQGKDVLVYRRDGANGRLDIPATVPLPWAHARLATLCSGLAPAWEDGSLGYENVPAGIARAIASSLGQDLSEPRAPRERGRAPRCQ